MTITIYKISNPNFERVYIGSTKKTINERKSTHFGNYKTYKNRGIGYCSSYELLEGNPIFEVLETFDNEEERYIREQYYYYLYPNRVNKNIPANTNGNMQEYLRNYYRTNRDYIVGYKNNKYVCTCGGHYSYANKQAHLKSLKHQRFKNNQPQNNQHLFQLIQDF